MVGHVCRSTARDIVNTSRNISGPGTVFLPKTEPQGTEREQQDAIIRPRLQEVFLPVAVEGGLLVACERELAPACFEARGLL